MTLTARYSFSASHRLHSSLLSEVRNDEVYGKCNNPYGHGHNYWLEVTVAGEPDAESGLILERHKLDELVTEEILSRVGHRNLNEQLPEMSGMVPTTENLTFVLAALLKKRFPVPGLSLERVRILETKNNRFETEANDLK